MPTLRTRSPHHQPLLYLITETTNTTTCTPYLPLLINFVLCFLVLCLWLQSWSRHFSPRTKRHLIAVWGWTIVKTSRQMTPYGFWPVRSSYSQCSQVRWLHSCSFGQFILLFSCVDSLTHLFTQSLTHSLIHSVTHSFPHSFTHSVTHLLIHWLTHSLIRSLTHSLTHTNFRTCMGHLHYYSSESTNSVAGIEAIAIAMASNTRFHIMVKNIHTKWWLYLQLKYAVILKKMRTQM